MRVGSTTVRSWLFSLQDFRCIIVALAWWFGNIKVSATTTFSRLPAVKTITSAISSGVNGSQPLQSELVRVYQQKQMEQARSHDSNLRIDSVSFRLVTTESYNRELCLDLAGVDADDPHSFGNELFS